MGGGHAQLTIPLVKAGYKVTVTGSDESCENRLRRHLHPGEYDFRVCNNLALDFADRSFDIVLAFRLLPHVDRWHELVRELCRVADKAVIVDYPDIRSWNILSEKLFSVKKSIEKNTRPYTLFSRRQIKNEFDRNSFMVEDLEPEFFLPMVIHRKMKMATLSQSAEHLFRISGLTKVFGSPVVAHFARKKGV